MEQEQAQPETPPEALLDQLDVSQDVIQGLLELLGEAWAENERLRMLHDNVEQASALHVPVSYLDQPQAGQNDGRYGILIVDDSRVLQTRLKATVESLGYKVIGIADNGIIGAEIALTRNPRLVILDYEMPEANGLEFLKAIRPHLADLKVIVCSAGLTETTSREFARLGVHDIILKPVQLNLLVKLIKQGMGD